MSLWIYYKAVQRTPHLRDFCGVQTANAPFKWNPPHQMADRMSPALSWSVTNLREPLPANGQCGGGHMGPIVPSPRISNWAFESPRFTSHPEVMTVYFLSPTFSLLISLALLFVNYFGFSFSR